MMLVAGYFRKRETLPYAVWTYPLSFISFHTYTVQVISCGHALFLHVMRVIYDLGKEFAGLGGKRVCGDILCCGRDKEYTWCPSRSRFIRHLIFRKRKVGEPAGVACDGHWIPDCPVRVASAKCEETGWQVEGLVV